MVFDIRAEDDGLLQEFLADLDVRSRAAAAAANVERPGFKLLSRTRPTHCDAGLQGLLELGAARHELTTMRLASGAGHDAVFMARIGPSVMLFIPCLKGRSHTPEEWAEPKDLEAGAMTLLDAVRALDDQGASS
jgi:N-carbamoyl-L-amino-acid hydrolase